jgi:outer membrane beta-barrel protein
LRTDFAWALLGLAVGLGGTARAQNQLEGLDLSDDPKDSRKTEPKPEALDVGPATTTAAPAPEEQVEPEPAGQVGERDVTQEDRVKSVQRKLYMKRGRLELSPAIAINVNDPYYTKWGGELRAAFYPADTLALALRFALLDTERTDDVVTAKANLSSMIYFSAPYWTATADAEWSPLYGKVAIFNSILHFDGYLVAGAGVAYTQTTSDPNPVRSGVKPAFDLGIGLRFVTTDWLAINAGLVNTSYVDTPVGTTKASLQNVMLVHLGVSIFFPLKSTYREAE